MHTLQLPNEETREEGRGSGIALPMGCNVKEEEGMLLHLPLGCNLCCFDSTLPWLRHNRGDFMS